MSDCTLALSVCGACEPTCTQENITTFPLTAQDPCPTRARANIDEVCAFIRQVYRLSSCVYPEGLRDYFICSWAGACDGVDVTSCFDESFFSGPGGGTPSTDTGTVPDTSTSLPGVGTTSTGTGTFPSTETTLFFPPGGGSTPPPSPPPTTTPVGETTPSPTIPTDEPSSTTGTTDGEEDEQCVAESSACEEAASCSGPECFSTEGLASVAWDSLQASSRSSFCPGGGREGEFVGGLTLEDICESYNSAVAANCDGPELHAYLTCVWQAECDMDISSCFGSGDGSDSTSNAAGFSDSQTNPTMPPLIEERSGAPRPLGLSLGSALAAAFVVLLVAFRGLGTS